MTSIKVKKKQKMNAVMKETVNYNKVFILFFNASTFKNVSELLINNPNILESTCNEFSGAVVNGLFASELFLKFLYAVDNKSGDNTTNIKTHSICILFYNLSEKRKKSIKEGLQDLGIDSKKFKSFLMKLKYSDNNKNNKNKGEYYDPINWRYLLDNHKNYNFDLNCMIKLNETLYNISLSEMNMLNLSDKEYNRLIKDLPKMKSDTIDDQSKNIINKYKIDRII